MAPEQIAAWRALVERYPASAVVMVPASDLLALLDAAGGK